MLIQNLITHGSKILKKNEIKSHILDSEVILSNLINISREQLLVKDNFKLSTKLKKKYDNAIYRRYKQEPVAYITGKKEFWSLNFSVNKNTLIPRPETELLVFAVKNIYKKRKINILDIGTGSGCIIISLLKELKQAKGIGLDFSAKAIETAKQNLKKFNLSNRLRLVVSRIENFYQGKFDLIVSNPPYIPFKEIKSLSKEIKNFEPLSALNGGIDGLDLIKKVIYKSNIILKTNGTLAIEIGNRQYIKVAALLRQHGYREIKKVSDYKGNVRCIISTKM